MATYIQGITDVIPQVQSWAPNLNFYSSVLGTKQSQYNQGWQQVNTIYNSILNAPMMREDTNSKRETFFEDISNQIKQISSVDLSLPQNVDMASDVFKPFYEDPLIIKDLSFTKKLQDEMSIAEMYRKCMDDKCKGKYWKGGVKAMQYKAQEFKEASPDKALRISLPEYVPYVNAMEKYGKAVKDLGFNVKYDTIKDGYIVTTKNGEKAKVPILNFLMSRFGDDPELQNFYNTKSYLTIKENPEYAIEQYKLAMQGQNERQAAIEAEKVIVKKEYDKSKKIISKAQDEQVNQYNSLSDQEKIVNARNRRGDIIPGTKDYDEFDRILNSKILTEKSIESINGIQKDIKKIDDSLVESGIENNMQQIQAVLAKTLQYKEIVGAAQVLAYSDYEQSVKADPYALVRYKAAFKNSGRSGNGNSGQGSNNIINPKELPVKYLKKEVLDKAKKLYENGQIEIEEYNTLKDIAGTGNKNFIEKAFTELRQKENQILEKRKIEENKVNHPVSNSGDNELFIDKAKIEKDEANASKAVSKYIEKINFMTSNIMRLGNASKINTGYNYVSKLYGSITKENSKDDTERELALAAKQELHYIANKLVKEYGIKNKNLEKLTDYNNIIPENVNNLYSSGDLKKLATVPGLSEVFFDVISKSDGYVDPDTKIKTKRFGVDTDMSFYEMTVKNNPQIALNIANANLADEAYEKVVSSMTSSFKTIQNKILGASKNGEAGDISNIIAKNLFEFKEGELPRIRGYNEIVDKIILGFKDEDLPEFYFTTRDDLADAWDGNSNNGILYTHSIKEIENQELKKGEQINLSPESIFKLITFSEYNYKNHTRIFSIFGGDNIESEVKKINTIVNKLNSNKDIKQNFYGTSYNGANLKILYLNKDKLNFERDGYNLKIKLKSEYQKKYNFKEIINIPFGDAEVDDRVLELIDEDGRSQYKTIAENAINEIAEKKTIFNKEFGGQGQFIARNSEFKIPKNTNSELFINSYDLINEVTSQVFSNTSEGFSNKTLDEAIEESKYNISGKEAYKIKMLKLYSDHISNYKSGNIDKDDFKQADIVYNPINENVFDSKVTIVFPNDLINDALSELDKDLQKEYLKFGNTFSFDIKDDNTNIKYKSLPNTIDVLVPDEGDEYTQTINNDFLITYYKLNNIIYTQPKMKIYDESISDFRITPITSDPIPVNNTFEALQLTRNLLETPFLKDIANSQREVAKNHQNKLQKNENQ